MIQKLGLDADEFNACDPFEKREKIMISIARLRFDHRSYSRRGFLEWMKEKCDWELF